MSTQKTILSDIKNNIPSYHLVDFAVTVDSSLKIKESLKRDKYLEINRELRNLWNMRLKMIPIVIDALGTVNKCSLRELDELEIGG